MSLLRRIHLPHVQLPLKVPLQAPQDPPGIPLRKLRTDRSVASLVVTFRTGIPIASLDASPDRTRAVIAGREIFKIIQVTDDCCIEEHNLRAAIVAYSAAHETAKGRTSSAFKIKQSANDVKWSHGSFDRKIATAASNGQIVVYDIDKAGIKWATLHEHNRQVHRLGFSPYNGSIMLSGSQDATVKLWDLRAYAGDSSKLTVQSRASFAGNNDVVRDVRWSPTSEFEFAIGTDAGIIQRWDSRKTNAPLLRMRAHERACSSIDWHPDGKHLASAGMDKDIKVWDFSSSDRKMKPSLSLRAPQAITEARWRPLSWQAAGMGQGSWQSTELVTALDNNDPRTLVWDLRSPYVPSRVFNQYDSPPTCTLWQSENILWLVGNHGIFTQLELADLPLRKQRMGGNGAIFTPRGHVLHVYCPPASQKGDHQSAKGSFIEALPLELAEDGSKGEHMSSRHDAKPSTFTKPPAFRQDGRPKLFAEPYKDIEEVLGTMDSYLPINQRLAMAVVRLPGVDADRRSFDFLAQHYKPLAPPYKRQASSVFITELQAILMRNSELALKVKRHLASSNFKILAQVAPEELEKRANANLQRRNNTASQLTSEEALKPQDSNHYEVADFDRPDEDLEDRTLCPLRTSSLLATMLKTSVETHQDVQFAVWCIVYLCPWFNVDSEAYSNIAVRRNLITQHHAHLRRNGLHIPAKELLNACVFDYPGFAELNPPSTLKIDVVSTPACVICHLATKTSLWRWCSNCGHGGHVKCLGPWFLNVERSEGRCPGLGCGCKCNPHAGEVGKTNPAAENGQGRALPNGWTIGKESRPLSAEEPEEGRKKKVTFGEGPE